MCLRLFVVSIVVDAKAYAICRALSLPCRLCTCTFRLILLHYFFFFRSFFPTRLEPTNRHCLQTTSYMISLHLNVVHTMASTALWSQSQYAILCHHRLLVRHIETRVLSLRTRVAIGVRDRFNDFYIEVAAAAAAPAKSERRRGEERKRETHRNLLFLALSQCTTLCVYIRYYSFSFSVSSFYKCIKYARIVNNFAILLPSSGTFPAANAPCALRLDIVRVVPFWFRCENVFLMLEKNM